MQYQLTLENGRRANGKLKTDYVEAFYQRPNRSPHDSQRERCRRVSKQDTNRGSNAADEQSLDSEERKE